MIQELEKYLLHVPIKGFILLWLLYFLQFIKLLFLNFILINNILNYSINNQRTWLPISFQPLLQHGLIKLLRWLLNIVSVLSSTVDSVIGHFFLIIVRRLSSSCQWWIWINWHSNILEFFNYVTITYHLLVLTLLYSAFQVVTVYCLFLWYTVLAFYRLFVLDFTCIILDVVIQYLLFGHFLFLGFDLIYHFFNLLLLFFFII